MSNTNISNEKQEEVAIWKNLQKYGAWKRVCAMLEEKLKAAELVINMLGGDHKAEFSKRDMAIIKKNAYLDLIEYPQKMIDMATGTIELPTEEMDPYEDNEQPKLEDF